MRTIERKRRRATGTTVAVCHDPNGEVFDPAGGPWVVFCEDHGTLCNFQTRAMAVWHAPMAEWCEECQERTEA